MSSKHCVAKSSLFAHPECRGIALRLLKLRGLSAAMAERSICEGAVL
jgi:hypothetical protein